MKKPGTISRSRLLKFLGIRHNSLSGRIKRGWGKQVPNPDYNGRNDRYLVLIESIRDEAVRERLKGMFSETDKTQSLSLEEAKQAGGSVLERTVLEGTVRHLATNSGYLCEHFLQEMEKTFQSYAGYYIGYKLSPARLKMYARTAAFAVIVQRMYTMLEAEVKGKDFKAYENAFYANLFAVVLTYKEPLQIICPGSYVRFTQWVRDKLSADFAHTPADELVRVKNAKNKARQKTQETQKEVINQWYGQGLTGRQIHEKLKVVSEKEGWPELSQGTVYRHINASENDTSLRRHGKLDFINNRVPAISRSLPVKKNEIWGVDATAHDELVNWKGKVQKQLWVCRVFDYGTMRLLGSSTSYRSEDGKMTTGAIARAVRFCGHAPEFINMDRGPAYHYTAEWCEKRHIRVMASEAGRARSKLIEQLLGQLRYYNMTLDGYVGQNRTARMLDSKVSGDRYDEAKRSAPGYTEAVRHAVEDTQAAWNSHVIKKSGKTPDELWAEKESHTGVLAPVVLAGYYGHQHQVKPGLGGLTVHRDLEEMTFFPAVDTGKARTAAVYFFKKHFKRERGRKRLTVCCPDGYTVAYVFDKPLAEGGCHLMTMPRKPEVALVAGTKAERELLSQFQAFQKAYSTRAEETLEQAAAVYGGHVDHAFFEAVKAEKYTGQSRQLHPESKAFLRLEDSGLVDGDGVIHEESPAFEYEDKTDPDTGEVVTIRKLKMKNAQ